MVETELTPTRKEYKSGMQTCKQIQSSKHLHLEKLPAPAALPGNTTLDRACRADGESLMG
jgi:hypothetical protein